MGAPVGNQFWKIRSKSGRDKIFSTPADLLNACHEYFNFQSQRFWVKKEAIKSGMSTGELVEIPTASPFTLEGLCLYLGVHSKYFNEFESRLDTKNNEIDKDFSNIITHVREVIYLQKLEGAMVGAYNQSIVSRNLGLAEITKGEITGKNGGAIETNNTLTINMISGAKLPAGSEKEIQESITAELGQ